MNAIWNAQFGFAPALAQALLHSLWEDALLAIVAALLLAAMAKRSAVASSALETPMLEPSDTGLTKTGYGNAASISATTASGSRCQRARLSG